MRRRATRSKAFFGIGNARAQNMATLDAIRSAFRDDPKLMVGYDKAESLLSSSGAAGGGYRTDSASREGSGDFMQV